MNKLTKAECLQLAETIPDATLREIIENAKIGVKDWTVASRCNKQFSRGKFWNIFLKNPFDPSKQRTIWKMRTLEEFGEFRHNYVLPRKNLAIKDVIPYHEDPIFD